MSEAEAPPATHTGAPREDVENEPLLAGDSGPAFDDLADKPEDRKGDHVEKFAAIVRVESFSFIYLIPIMAP